MDAKQFFATVVKMRKLQKHREKFRDIDPYTKRECIKVEEEIDREIKRVQIVMKENNQQTFFDL